MKIGLVGVDLSSPNKGCEALAYAALELLNQIAKKHSEIYEVFVIRKTPYKALIKSGLSYKKIVKQFSPKHDFSNLKIESLLINHFKDEMFYSNKISKLNFVFDFTGGDSFTDIYGEQRFYSRTKLKKAIIDHDVPLILGSQTIGPFSCNNVTDYASKVIKDCLEVFTRDEMSYDYVKKITGRKAVLTTDVAFSLPYVKSTKVDTNGKTIGLNVSGLLWNGGYTKDNQFGLKVDYQEYSRKLVSYLLNKGYEVHLIPHAFKRDLTDVDNDLVAILKLHEEYPNTIVSPYFDSCIEAKSYIAKMDIFLGARMHSTIGAFSAGVPVIPFSYSRKFEGLFQSLEYPYVLNARELDTNACLKKTIEWIDNCSILALDMNEGHKIIQSRTANFTERLDSLFYAQ